MKEFIKVGVLTAGDETPDCFRCDHTDATVEYCSECVKNFWAHYKRTEYIVIEREEE